MGLKSLLRDAGLLDDLADIERGIKEGRKDIERSVKNAKKKVKGELKNLSLEDIAQILPVLAPGVALPLASLRNVLSIAEASDRKKIVEALEAKVETLGNDKFLELAKKVEKKTSDAVSPEVLALLQALGKA